MDNITVLPGDTIGYNFIPHEYLPKDRDEHYLRNEQSDKPDDTWRQLTAHEVEALVKNGNSSDNWKNLLVADPFDPGQIKDSEFFGIVRIGRVQNTALEYHDLKLPVGITSSRIISCDIGHDAVIHHVRYLAHYIVGDRCILTDIDEMHTTHYAKFGNGILKDGEDEKIRIWLDIMNETGSRQVLPFDGIIPADAYLWAKYRDDEALQQQLKEITQSNGDSRHGFYGTIGDQCVIKSCRIIKDVKVGSCAYIKGANKLKNLTINSDSEEPTQIGEGVELVNGIIGYGCHLFYGCKAVRFILANNSNLKYGARLINSFLGDNSTISCCEVLVGSNHNSRANDNEIQAGRGFWPGLCTSVKHSCRFASFVLLAKADYPAELDIRLPFALLNNNVLKDELEVLPGFWWLYNMYALARNTWKFQSRDKRKRKIQKIEFDSLAPDTAEEILQGRRLLEIWTAKAALQKTGGEDTNEDQLAVVGRELLSNPDSLKGVEVLGEKMEKSRRKAVILKPYEGYHAYGDMLHYYAVKNLMEAMTSMGGSFSDMSNALKDGCCHQWVNLGGQLVRAEDVEQLRKDIGEGILRTWDDIHARYAELWAAYPLEKQKHAYRTLCRMLETDELTETQWCTALDKTATIQEYIRDQVYASRKKDYDNPFRQATYRNTEEMVASIGTIEDNSFVKLVREETESFKAAVEEMKKKN
ncbi:MAG: DUF4954 family protein [Planctomycetota bacterium]|jgi:hypothetical protein